jgi:spore coat protein U-like protein
VQFTGFGRLPQGQYVPAGAYSDRITVTVAF